LPDFLLSEVVRLLQRLITIPDFFILEFPVLPLWLWLFLLCVVILQFLYPRLQIEMAGILVLLICFNYSPKRPLSNEFLLDILDVGQGLAVVVTTHTHQLVYDTGPAYNPRFNAGSGIIQPFFRHQNLKAPDIIVVSHGDNDHAGGLAALARYFPASTIYAGETSLLPAKLDNPPEMHQCLAGINWWWDQVKFEFLYPREHSLSGNNASCVLKISAGSYSALLTGDIEKEAELALLKNARNALQADIMTAPHHGSKTSSIAPFIRRVAPAHVVFSSGYLNSFGHPHDDVRQRYTELDSRLYDTSTSGALRFHLSAAQGIKSVTSHRQARRRLWHLD
jgi:competence protein ComEC